MNALLGEGTQDPGFVIPVFQNKISLNEFAHANQNPRDQILQRYVFSIYEKDRIQQYTWYQSLARDTHSCLESVL